MRNLQFALFSIHCVLGCPQFTVCIVYVYLYIYIVYCEVQFLVFSVRFSGCNGHVTKPSFVPFFKTYIIDLTGPADNRPSSEKLQQYIYVYIFLLHGTCDM